jgi:hypothetical protein
MKTATDRVFVKLDITENHIKSKITQADNMKTLYSVPKNLPLGQLLSVFRTKLQLSSSEALFMFVNQTLYSSSTLLDSIPIPENKIYNIELYRENTFGK